MTSVALITASVGPDPWPIITPIDQDGVDLRFYPFTDTNLPPRPCALHPRVLSKIPRVWGWDMVPAADLYLWLDAAFTLRHAHTLTEWIAKLGDHDVALFRHPTRQTVAEEVTFIRERLAHSARLMQRYTGEYIDEVKRVDGSAPLYAAGAFLYRLTPKWIEAMRIWWEHITRFHLMDQFWLPHALQATGCTVAVLQDDYYRNLFLRGVHKPAPARTA